MAGKLIEVPAVEPVTVAGNPVDLPLAEEDGIYFGLDAEAQYHPSSGLGSGSIKRLFYNAGTFWWHSAMNPLRPADKETSAKSFGKAVHVRVLEGEGKFHGLYECQYEGSDLLRTDADIKAWIESTGNKPVSGLKGARVQQALLIDPDLAIEDVIKQRADDAGRAILAADDYNRILVSSKLIADNPDLETAFAGGRPEVAIVWTETIDGQQVKCKALLDYLKIRGTGDLKSASNTDGIDFPTVCRNSFVRYRYDIQAAHYMRAREFLPRFVAEGRVFGDHDADWLRKVAAQQEYGFAFVFFSTTGAPETFAFSLSPGNVILDLGADHRAIALNNFARNRAEHGTDMWLRREPIRELDISELPAWYGRVA